MIFSLHHLTLRPITSHVSTEETIHSELVSNPKFHIDCDPATNKVTGRWLGKNQQQRHVKVNPMIIQYFQKRVDQNDIMLPEDKVQPLAWGWTEYQCDGKMFHAHPNYHLQGAWYDWAMVKWENPCISEVHPIFEMEFEESFFPCKLLGFFQMQRHDNKEDDNKEERTEPIMVLLHACSSLIDNGLQNMHLTEMWQLSYWPTKESTFPLDLNGKRKRDYDR